MVVDTNVVSELMKSSPIEIVKKWFLRQDSREMRITSITVAEILYGIERLPSGQRREKLRDVALGIFDGFAEQILSFDAVAATHYSKIVTSREKQGNPISGFDAQIAAICRSHEAQLATRNEKDFVRVGVNIINPWTDQRG
jgi:predicted nucleic acid-binding protein